MKTWYIENLENISLHEAVLQRKDNEVKLKMSKIAISSTDISYFASDEGSIKIPGHAAIAYVSEAEPESGFKLGARAVIDPFLCVTENGEKVIKTMGVDIEGLLADFVSVPAENVYILPDGIKDEEAIFAESIAFGIKIFAETECEKGDYVVIVGASTLGIIMGQLALYYQMIPIVIDLDADKLKLVEKWGVYYTLNPTYDNLERRIEEITGGRMAEFLAYVGDGITCDAAVRLVKNGGKAVIAGYSSLVKHKIDMNTILKKQLTVKGISNGNGEMASAINLLANHIVKTEGIISSIIGFNDVPSMVCECVKYPNQFNKILITL